MTDEKALTVLVQQVAARLLAGAVRWSRQSPVPGADR
jgi:hypothetical protein